jgi:hypothetical protein
MRVRVAFHSLHCFIVGVRTIKALGAVAHILAAIILWFAIVSTARFASSSRSGGFVLCFPLLLYYFF